MTTPETTDRGCRQSPGKVTFKDKDTIFSRPGWTLKFCFEACRVPVPCKAADATNVIRRFNMHHVKR